MKNNGAVKQNSTGRTAIKVAVSVIAALIVAVIAFLLLKNTVYYSVAESRVEDNRFKSAQSILEGIDTEKAEVLSEYTALRISINSRYASLLADFDITAIEEWQSSANRILAASDNLPENIKSDVQTLSEKLSLISSLYYEYSDMEPDILDMMDVFAETNRLYTKDETGSNIAFTIQEENGKINGWETENDELSVFAEQLPGGDSVYLLSYLIKETQGECDDLRKSMNTILDSGFSETDQVRVNGDAHESYPSVTNKDGVSVNVAEKETYVQYLKAGILRALAESLSDYYIGI